MGLIDLYDETMGVLSKNKKTFDDVIAICGKEFQITKDDFLKYSHTEYNNGFGACRVAKDLLIIGSDWWLERNENRGAEYWKFKRFPNYKNLPFKKINALTLDQADENWVHCSNYGTLAEFNDISTI